MFLVLDEVSSSAVSCVSFRGPLGPFSAPLSGLSFWLTVGDMAMIIRRAVSAVAVVYTFRHKKCSREVS